jgi:hypothetical protein
VSIVYNIYSVFNNTVHLNRISETGNTCCLCCYDSLVRVVIPVWADTTDIEPFKDDW